MKKTHLFLIFLLMSSFLFAQVIKNDKAIFKSVNVAKEINTIKNGTKAWTDSIHYDGPNGNAVGLANGGEFGVYMVIPQDSLTANAGKSLNDVKLYLNDIASAGISYSEIRLYTDLTTDPIYTQSFTPVDGWNLVSLTTPFALPKTGYLAAGYFISHSSGHPAGLDTKAAEPNGNGNLMYYDGWMHLSDMGQNGNWNIRAMIGEPSPYPTAKINHNTWDAGNVPISSSKTATFTLLNIGGGTLTSTGITGVSAPFTTDFNPASVNLGAGESYSFKITFTPTEESATNQTVTIATNGGNITINLSGTGVTCNVISTFPWTESFEDFLPACWTKANPDGGTGWNVVPYGANPLPGWGSGIGSLPFLDGGGNLATYCTWNTGGPSSNDQWLITPQIAVQNNQELSFYIFYVTPYPDNLDIKISTTTNDVASFGTILHSFVNTDFIDGEWMKITIPLDGYAGQNVYIAFNEHIADNNTSGGFMAIDLVKVDTKSSTIENEAEKIKIFPNPANDYIKVYTNELSNITITDLRGSIVYTGQVNNNDIISTENFCSGIYIVTIESKDSINRTKLIIK